MTDEIKKEGPRVVRVTDDQMIEYLNQANYVEILLSISTALDISIEQANEAMLDSLFKEGQVEEYLEFQPNNPENGHPKGRVARPLVRELLKAHGRQADQSAISKVEEILSGKGIEPLQDPDFYQR